MMELFTVKDFFFWMMILNAALFLLSVLLIVILKNPLARLFSRLYGISEDRYREMAFRGLALYKILILFFNVIPWLVLCMAQR
ncbi:hypothetical protein JXR74_06345 [Candidatus Mcinerneyibacteriota bacterium]|nr:hypothetical protein [Candidatus Mcinerneyibacteriota bacterium]